MDHIDETILRILTDDARCSFSELGRQIGLSTNAAAARVHRLERDQVILGYTVVTAAERSAPRRGGLEVYIDLRLDSQTDNPSFEKAVGELPQIIDAVHLTGPFDYLLHAVVVDTAALDALIKHLKRSCGAAQTQTRVALR